MTADEENVEVSDGGCGGGARVDPVPRRVKLRALLIKDFNNLEQFIWNDLFFF